MNTEDSTKFIKEKNKLYTFIWLFLIAELAAFFIVSYFILVPEIPKERIQTGNDFNTILLYLSYFVVIISIPLAYKIYDIKRKQAKEKNTIKQKTEVYFITLLIIYSLFEFSAIFTLVAFYINKMNEPLYMFGIIFVAVLLNKPSLKKFIQVNPHTDESEHIIIPENENSNASEKQSEEIK